MGRSCRVNLFHPVAGGRGLRSSIYVMRGRGLQFIFRRLIILAAAAGAVALSDATASADTLEWALVQAYQNNPSLNAQRAALRAADENVPQALSGYRPKLSVTASGGFNYFREVNKSVNQQVFPNSVNYTSRYPAIRRDCDAKLFNGFQTANRTRQAESQVMGARDYQQVRDPGSAFELRTADRQALRIFGPFPDSGGADEQETTSSEEPVKRGAAWRRRPNPKNHRWRKYSLRFAVLSLRTIRTSRHRLRLRPQALSLIPTLA